ncbi:helix-turn-helix transcriptional regulator [Streptomyces sp. NPDC057539]|uniref:helix-turn-helix transcriptional regulator n=1 Tax=Streptomyces sp. NPDC057539 TaxID=3346159 RepID=UPI003687F97F
MAGEERIWPMIRRLREERGLSQADLARKLNEAAGGTPTLDRQHVYRWEAGRRTPRDWLPFLAAVLRVDVEVLERATAAGEVAAPAPTVADFLPEDDPLAPLAVWDGRRIGASTVADLTSRVHGLRLADDVVYGRDLIGRAMRELRSAATLYRESTFTNVTGRQLLQGIGELARIAGWIASDAGQHEDAERICRLGPVGSAPGGGHHPCGQPAGVACLPGVERRRSPRKRCDGQGGSRRGDRCATSGPCPVPRSGGVGARPGRTAATRH